MKIKTYFISYAHEKGFGRIEYIYNPEEGLSWEMFFNKVENEIAEKFKYKIMPVIINIQLLKKCP